MFKFILLADALFFLFYGMQCFISRFMIAEFKRFGMTKSQRILTATLQLLSAIGLVAGLYIPVFGLFAATGLAVMMLVAFGVRIKIKDGFAESAPSLIFMVLNGYLALGFYNLM